MAVGALAVRSIRAAPGCSPARMPVCGSSIAASNSAGPGSEMNTTAVVRRIERAVDTHAPSLARTEPRPLPGGGHEPKPNGRRRLGSSRSASPSFRFRPSQSALCDCPPHGNNHHRPTMNDNRVRQPSARAGSGAAAAGRSVRRVVIGIPCYLNPPNSARASSRSGVSCPSVNIPCSGLRRSPASASRPS